MCTHSGFLDIVCLAMDRRRRVPRLATDRKQGRGGTETGRVREEITTCCQHRLGATAARKPRVCLSHFLPAAIKTSHWLAVCPQRAGHAQQGTGGLLLKVLCRSRFSSVQCCFTSTETVRTVRVGELRTPTSTFTQLLNSDCLPVVRSMLLSVHRDRTDC